MNCLQDIKTLCHSCYRFWAFLCVDTPAPCFLLPLVAEFEAYMSSLYCRLLYHVNCFQLCGFFAHRLQPIFCACLLCTRAFSQDLAQGSSSRLQGGISLYMVSCKDLEYIWEGGGFFFSLFLFGCIYGVWNFPGQGSNPRHSSSLRCCSDNTRSLTCCNTGELLLEGFTGEVFPCGLWTGFLLESRTVIRNCIPLIPSWKLACHSSDLLSPPSHDTPLECCKREWVSSAASHTSRGVRHSLTGSSFSWGKSWAVWCSLGGGVMPAKSSCSCPSASRLYCSFLLLY